MLSCAATGDNALDYVIEGAKVSAVDFNSCQIALVELKVCAAIDFDIVNIQLPRVR